MAVLGGVFGAEAFEKGADDVGFKDAGDEVGVEAFGFVGVAEDEDSGFVGAFDVAAGVAADDEEEGGEAGDDSHGEGSVAGSVEEGQCFFCRG